AADQAPCGVLEVVPILHDLLSFITPIKPTLLQVFPKRGEHFQAPRMHSLPHMQNSRLQTVLYRSHLQAKLPIHLEQTDTHPLGSGRSLRDRLSRESSPLGSVSRLRGWRAPLPHHTRYRDTARRTQD